MKDPFKYLDDEERELTESVERGERKRTDNFEEEKKKAESAAKTALAGTERKDICISERDIGRLKIRASEEGVPYQRHRFPASSVNILTELKPPHETDVLIVRHKIRSRRDN